MNMQLKHIILKEETSKEIKVLSLHLHAASPHEYEYQVNRYDSYDNNVLSSSVYDTLDWAVEDYNKIILNRG